MNADDNDKLWKLLGQARPPAVSPFFARNVLRAVRQEEVARAAPSFLRSLFAGLARCMRRWAWQSAFAATCAVAVLATVAPNVFVRHHQTRDADSVGVAREIAGNPDYEVINHLDELVADEENSVWLDDSPHDPAVH